MSHLISIHPRSGPQMMLTDFLSAEELRAPVLVTRVPASDIVPGVALPLVRHVLPRPAI